MGNRTILKKLLAFIVMISMIFSLAFAEKVDENKRETTTLYVTANRLNGRARPSKQSSVEARFEKGDPLKAYGWDESHNWIEVIGGETATVWIWWEYVTERTDSFDVWNGYGEKVKLRKKPFGKVTGYLKNDGELLIDQVVLGWGHSSRGWIDLSYLTEED